MGEEKRKKKGKKKRKNKRKKRKKEGHRRDVISKLRKSTLIRKPRDANDTTFSSLFARRIDEVFQKDTDSFTNSSLGKWIRKDPMLFHSFFFFSFFGFPGFS